MRAKGKNTSKPRLQFKMTVFITAAVLLVSTAILAVIAGRIRKDYEEMLGELISDDLDAITQNIEQRMLRLEDATNTMARIAALIPLRERDMDSLLLRTAEAIEDVVDVSVTFRKGCLPGLDGYYQLHATSDTTGTFTTGRYDLSGRIESNEYWQSCYGEGKSVWTEPAKEPGSGVDIVCYAVPLYDVSGERIGMAHSAVQLQHLTSFVTSYKAREDIDISIRSPRGATVVAPDDYILELDKDDLVTDERSIERTGWTVILSADKAVIEKLVRKALLSLALLIVLMFIVITLTIIVTVRLVAKPFVDRQQLTEKEKAVMDNELRLAAAAQHDLVPHTFPPFPQRKGLELSACLYPARDVGGDLYDYFLDGDKLYFCIGDVSGKGLQASLFMAAAHYLFRSVASGMPAADAVRQMNVSLCTDNEQCRFVTFWFGCLDLGSGSLEYVNAGHDAPVFLRDGGATLFPASKNMPLGAWEEAGFVSESTTLEPGDTLLLYTDGVTEAMDAGGQEFSRARLLDTLGKTAAADASGIMDDVLANVREHASGAEQSDDITMLCIRFLMKETKQQNI